MAPTGELDHVYGAKDSTAIREAYDAWAPGYDAENIAKGYRVHAIGAAFLSRYVAPGDGPVLDAGCGTGLVGECLGILGYADLVGTDISEGMLETARTLGAYKRVFQHDLGVPLPEAEGHYRAVICVGSLGPGHAPPHCVAEFARVTGPGGHVVLAPRVDTYEAQGLRATLDDLTDAGVWSLEEVSPEFQPFQIAEPEIKSRIMVFTVA